MAGGEGQTGGGGVWGSLREGQGKRGPRGQSEWCTSKHLRVHGKGAARRKVESKPVNGKKVTISG